MTQEIADMFREIRAELAKIREQQREPAAVKRREAARLMGMSVDKLELLIRKGRVATAEDVHLVPMSEVRRYCAPKTKRQRKPSVGVRASRRIKAEGWTLESKAELRRKLKAVTE